MKNDPDISYYENQWHKWDDMKSFGPMSRLVRRKILTLLKQLEFSSVLDVGCGVGTLLRDISIVQPKAKLSGTELYSDSLKIAKKRIPRGTFKNLDLVKQCLPKKFDLTLCIDVFEHIPEDLRAMKNLAKMTRKYCVIVVPLGPLFEIERERVGHVHGYSQKEFDKKLTDSGFKIISSETWGFPFYNIYRRVLHKFPESSTIGTYTWKKKLTSQILFLILSLNLKSPWGERYFVLCKPK